MTKIIASIATNRTTKTRRQQHASPAPNSGGLGVTGGDALAVLVIIGGMSMTEASLWPD